ncbi:MAG: class B sortase [Mogibacterium sp.]|nr:class B sortase [Mogibacterium sp.]
MAKKARSKNARIRRGAENVIMVCLAAIVVISGWKIYTIMRGYHEGQEVYKKISEQTAAQGFTGDIDWDKLRKINPEVVGWLYYEDTVIDYPVVKGQDNDRYLYTMFDGSVGGFGTLFADAATEAPFRQFNTIVYGHHMRDGSMFAPLKRLKDSSYAGEHPQLELITPEGKFHLLIWAFLNQPADSQIYMTNIHDKEERAAYLELIRDLADYTTDVEVSVEDRLVILSTCAYEYQDARYMVVGKMVPWDGQKINMSYDEPEETDAEADGLENSEDGGSDE